MCSLRWWTYGIFFSFITLWTVQLSYIVNVWPTSHRLENELKGTPVAHVNLNQVQRRISYVLLQSFSKEDT